MFKLWQTIKSMIYVLIRCLIKSFLRKTTKLCELQRICYANNFGSNRSKSVEYSITNSRSKVLRKIDTELTRLASTQLLTNKWILFEKAIEATVVEKRINTKIHIDFIPSYRICLVHIYGYKQLVQQIQSMRAVSYDTKDRSHQKMLESLWTQLMDQPLNGLISKQWSDIGFQGEDPSTDFRGMGLLGLDDLLFFATVYTESARHIVQHSLHPTHGYPFAIVGINLTHLALNLLISGQLKTHFFNSYNRLFKVEDFHRVYCYLFVSFHKLWLTSKPKSVMEFSYIRDQFEKQMIEKLCDEKTILKWDPHIETL